MQRVPRGLAGNGAYAATEKARFVTGERMAAEHVYEKEQIEQVIASASNLFDVVRLVDPISMTVYEFENGELRARPGGCHRVWGKEDRCDNCISAKCFMDERRYSKFEFIDQDIYHVVAQCVEIDGQKFVLEVVTASNDDVLLSAFGTNDFVERITSFNRKVYADELTGLSNRRCMNDRFAILADCCVREGAPLAVVMADIDDFKRINDTYGHLVGDEALKFAADALHKGVRPEPDDIVARYGGDEFFVALKGITQEDLKQRLKDVCARIAANPYGITLSIGAYYQTASRISDTEKLIHKADEAMYEIKSNNKNGCRIRE